MDEAVEAELSSPASEVSPLLPTELNSLLTLPVLSDPVFSLGLSALPRSHGPTIDAVINSLRLPVSPRDNDDARW
jgi:hypothetical protein